MTQATPTPKTMKAAVLTDLNSLEVRHIPVPRPRSGEALVKIIACGVCHTDLHVMRGEVAFPTPAVLGHEISGTVVEFGPNTDPGDLQVGTDVVGAFIMPCTTCAECQSGRDDLCANFFAQNRLNGTLYDGQSRLTDANGVVLAMYSMAGLAQYSVVPVSALAPVPTSLDPIPAATLGCAAFTAYGAVHRASGISEGDTVAVVAIGGVGTAIVQMAREAGAQQIIAIDVEDNKLTSATQHGATHTINSTTQDVAATVDAITGGTGVNIAFEALGLPETFELATSILGDGGRMVAVGIAKGRESASVEITRLVRRGHMVIGSFGARTRTDLPAVVALAAGGHIDTASLVTRTYSLDDAAAAYQALQNGEIIGRAVISMTT